MSQVNLTAFKTPLHALVSLSGYPKPDGSGVKCIETIESDAGQCVCLFDDSKLADAYWRKRGANPCCRAHALDNNALLALVAALRHRGLSQYVLNLDPATDEGDGPISADELEQAIKDATVIP